MNNATVAALICAAVLASGCATKRSGQLMPVVPAEAASLTCEQIVIELQRVDAFEQVIQENSNIDVRSFAAFFIDFGVGNKIERRRSQESANQRRAQLNALYAERGCAPQPVAAAPEG
jgi:hypothetical protein